MVKNTPQQRYIRAMQRVIKIRMDRQKVYGDSWILDPIPFDIWMLHGKVGRLKYILSHGDNDYEKMEDTLLDIVNYALFSLAKIGEQKR